MRQSWIVRFNGYGGTQEALIGCEIGDAVDVLVDDWVGSFHRVAYGVVTEVCKAADPETAIPPTAEAHVTCPDGSVGVYTIGQSVTVGIRQISVGSIKVLVG